VQTRTRQQNGGTIHGGEIPFVFGNWERVGMGLATDEDNAMAELAHQCWVDFAKSGAPACAGGRWARYSAATDAPFEFAEQSGLRPGFRRAQYDALGQVMLPIFL